MNLRLGFVACLLLGCDASSASDATEDGVRSPHDASAVDPQTTGGGTHESTPMVRIDAGERPPPTTDEGTSAETTTEPPGGSAPDTTHDDGPADDEPADDESTTGDDESTTDDDESTTDDDESTTGDDESTTDDDESAPDPDEEPVADPDALGAYPVDDSPVTRGGTMTFGNVGAKGSWPRRLDREMGDAACDYKDGTDTWGGQCCMTEYTTQSESLSPFDEEMTLILKAIDVKQLAVYQPRAGDDTEWGRVSAWDARTATSDNLWFTQEGDGSTTFPGNLTHDDCVGYVMQEPSFDCANAAYSCPNDSGILHQGFSGSKLVVFLASMKVDDAALTECNGDGPGHPGPWVAFVASELIRDGGRKWNGLCNCYSKTGSVGDGCGEINVFEIVMDNNEFSNREFASTGVRSYQAGHVGGAVCKSDCERDAFAADADVVDACAGVAYEHGPELEVGGATDGCPVWRRPEGDRYFFILLDAPSRTIQVGMIHPGNIPPAAGRLLPSLPGDLTRSEIDGLVDLRLPE